jgi:hypothetical protein
MSAHNFDSNALAGLAPTAVAGKVPPQVSPAGAGIEGFSRLALSHGHGVGLEHSVGLPYQSSEREPELPAHCSRTLVIIGKVVGAQWVVGPVVKHFGLKRYVRKNNRVRRPHQTCVCGLKEHARLKEHATNIKKAVCIYRYLHLCLCLVSISVSVSIHQYI